MKNILKESFILPTWLAASACTAYQPDPLSLNHPAHMAAPVASERPRSQTLAFTRVDVTATRPSASSTADSNKAEPESSKTVTAEGKVVAAVPSSGQIVLEHGEIKGFMEAMTMGYRVESPALLEGLNFGDRVRFSIDPGKKTIVRIEKIK